jgi:hypothetical protein
VIAPSSSIFLRRRDFAGKKSLLFGIIATRAIKRVYRNGVSPVKFSRNFTVKTVLTLSVIGFSAPVAINAYLTEKVNKRPFSAHMIEIIHEF